MLYTIQVCYRFPNYPDSCFTQLCNASQITLTRTRKIAVESWKKRTDIIINWMKIISLTGHEIEDIFCENGRLIAEKSNGNRYFINNDGTLKR